MDCEYTPADASGSIFSDPQLGKCQVMTAAWHFFITTVVLLAATMSPLNAFKRRALPLKDVVPIACFFVGFLLLANVSLALNSVPFYQLAKMMTMPAVALLSFLLWNKRVSAPVLTTIVVITAGVILSGYEAATANGLGVIVAVAAFTVTALYQLWIAKKITELNVQPPQLLLNQAPAAVVLLLCILPFVDTIPDFATVDPRALFALFISGFLAAAINLSQFLIIGRTSALTFNVIGIAKNTVIVTAGWIMHGTILGWKDVVGALLALSGASAYSYLLLNN